MICRECPPDKRGALEEAPVALEEGGRKKCFFRVDDVAIPERQMEPDVRLNDTSDSDSMPVLGRRRAKMNSTTQKTKRDVHGNKSRSVKIKRYVMHDGRGKIGEVLGQSKK